MSFVALDRRWRIALFCTSAIVALPFLIENPANAQQYDWGGSGSTTTTSDYHLGSNWSDPPAGAPPITAGNSATFSATGSSSVSVGAGSIAPDSWTFSSTSQNYTVTGAAINFSGSGTVLTNEGGTNSIANNIAGGNVLVSGGSLTLSGSNTLNSVTIYNGVTLVAGSNGAFGNATITGYDGTLELANGVSLSNRFEIGNILPTFSVSSGSATFSGEIIETADPATLVKAGAGTLIITNNTNNFSGGVRINAGTLQVASDFALRTGTITLNGGTLQAGANITPSNLTIDLASPTSTIDTNGFTITYGGSIQDAALGAVLIKTGAGTLALTGQNSFANASVNAGVLQGGVANAFRSDLALALVTGGTLDLGGFNQSIGALSGDSTGIVTNSGATASVLTAGGVASSTFAGTIQDGAGSVALTKGGAGTLTLSGTNSYTGGTTISAGTLQIGGGGMTGSIVGDVVNNGTLAFNRSNAISYNGIISGSGAVSQIGTGTTTLGAASTYTGNTSVSQGVLALSLTGSITSNVTVSAGTFQNDGLVSGSVSNSGVFVQSAGSVTGGLTNTGTVNANAGAINGVIANNAGTFNVGGTVTSNSTFGNANGAGLAVGTGATYTVAGLLANAGVVTVAAGGTLVATGGGITNAATGTITVAAGGTVRDDLNNVGAVTNNGAYFATVASNTGTIINNATWTGNVTNTGGTVTNASGATWTGNATNSSGTFNNAGAISGSLTNTGGTTNNTGAVSGTITVTGGTYTGSGAVGTLSLGSSSTFVAGNGVAGSTSTVNGSLAFQSGAAYVVSVNPATSSRAVVTGTATLGGASVIANFDNGFYVRKQYTILTAGSVTGAFGNVVNNNLPANFRTNVSYDAANVYLNLDLAFADQAGFNQNQKSVSNTLVGVFNRLGFIPMAFGGLSQNTLTQVSGETATGAQQATFDAMNQFMGVMIDPFTAGRDVAIGNATAFAADDDALAYASNARKRSRAERDAFAMFVKSPPKVYEARWNVWAAGFGGARTTDGDAGLGSNRTTSNVAGAAVGADYWFSPATVAGFSLAGGGSRFSVANGGSGTSDLFQAGAFVRHSVGSVYISAAAAYGWQDIRTDRVVTAAGVDVLRANFKANAYSGRIEAGNRWLSPSFDGVGLTPYAAVQVTAFDLPTYSETVANGVGNFALTYAGKTVTNTRTELGLRTDKSFAVNDAILTLRGRAAWAHDFNTDRSASATFQSLPGASFVVNGSAVAANAALTSASAEMKWANGWSTAATFEGEFSDVTRSYAGKGVVRYAW